MHKCREGKFRPSLTEVGGAAAVLGFKTEKMSLTLVCTKDCFAGEADAGDLVALLIVLMRPHIVADRRGEGIEGENFESFRPFEVAGSGEKMLIGVHLLGNGAKLGALDRGKSRKAFVAREEPDGGAVVGLQHVRELFGNVCVFLAEKVVADRLVFQHHAEVYDVGLIGPFVERTLPKVRHLRVIRALLSEDPCKIGEPFLVIAFFEEIYCNKSLKPARFAPFEERDRTRGEQIVVVLEHSVENRGDSFVARAFVVDDENLRDKLNRPGVVGGDVFLGAGADPSAFLLEGDDRVDVFLCARDLVLVLEQVCERDEAVEPIGHALPALGVTADPRAVANVAPDLVKVTRKRFCLYFKLTAKPTFGLYFI